METSIKTALDTLFAKANNVPILHILKAATGFVLVRSCGTCTVLTVTRDDLNTGINKILSVTS
jgi:hypothetical protein